MSYFSEFRTCWRFLAAAGLGMGAGYSLVNYINNLFTPHLIEQFNWTRSEIALVGVAAFLGIVTQPVAGRLTDALGVRRMATVGVVTAPLVFVGLANMTGPLWQFFLLTFIQIIIVGGTTSAVIYSRLIAQSFDRARGVAFAIAASTAPVAGAASAPALSALIDVQGWRAGYYVLALSVAIAGCMALALIPAGVDARRRAPLTGDNPATRYAVIFRNRAFQLILAGVILCNMSFTLQTAHLKVILLDNGVASATGSLAVSVFAFSVIIGRMLCGVALDRFPSYLVTAVALGLPGVGLGLLATGSSESFVIFSAALLLGLALGAEGDVLAYVVGKYFKLEVFSTILGMVLGGLALSIAAGSLLLSFLLNATDSYNAFLAVSSISALTGSVMFVLLGRQPTVG